MKMLVIWLLRGRVDGLTHEPRLGIPAWWALPQSSPSFPQSVRIHGSAKDTMRKKLLGILSLLALFCTGGYGRAVEIAAGTGPEPSGEAFLTSNAMPDSDLLFAHQLHRPEHPSGHTIVLLHGSGGDETSLVPLASRIAPNATLLAVRGRVVQEGVQRWYRRITPVEFDQEDVRAEATAFAEFLSGAADIYGLDLSSTTFLGYSNGANLIAAMTLLHPNMVQRAVLLRPMCVLNEAPPADLADIRFLTVVGKADELYAPRASELEEVLRGRGARVDARVIPSGHELGDEDVRVVSEWLSAANLDKAKLQ